MILQSYKRHAVAGKFAQVSLALEICTFTTSHRASMKIRPRLEVLMPMGLSVCVVSYGTRCGKKQNRASCRWVGALGSDALSEASASGIQFLIFYIKCIVLSFVKSRQIQSHIKLSSAFIDMI